MSAIALPNLLLLTLDTVRWDSLGCFGAATETPCIDGLASDGVVFDQAISNGSYTKSAFPPLLSSTYASHYGGPFVDLSQRRPMLAQVLQRAGYRTAGFTANPLLGANLGYHAGFDRFEEPVPPPESRAWLKLKGAQAVLRNPTLNGLLAAVGFDTVPHPVYVAGDEIANRGLSWLDAGESPFFLWLHWMDAHWPYHEMEALKDGHSRSAAWRDLHIMWESRGKYPGDEVMNRLRDLYAASIERLDRELARLAGGMEELDLLADTVVVVTSDHGEAFHEHGRWQHGAVFDFHEEVIRVPLIIRAPGWPRGRRVSELVSLMDLAPTLLDLAGLEAPIEMEGESFRSMVEEGSSGSRYVISEMVDLNWYCVALRSERHKYIYDERRPSMRQLFDLVDDPDEKHDLYGSRPQVEAEFEARLQEHLRRIQSEAARSSAGGWEVEEDVVRRLRSLGYIE